MMENLPLFIALVLAAHLSDRANAISLFGEQLFFCARLLHGIVYVIGIPHARTLMWDISLIGAPVLNRYQCRQPSLSLPQGQGDRI